MFLHSSLLLCIFDSLAMQICNVSLLTEVCHSKKKKIKQRGDEVVLYAEGVSRQVRQQKKA